jgi:hypothetical protein
LQHSKSFVVITIIIFTCISKILQTKWWNSCSYLPFMYYCKTKGDNSLAQITMEWSYLPLYITTEQNENINWHKLLWNTGFTKMYVGLMVLVEKKCQSSIIFYCKIPILCQFLIKNLLKFCWSYLTGLTNFTISVEWWET